jgi:hypothetical protein
VEIAMGKKVTIALLAIGLAVYVPAILRFYHEIAFGQFWLEIGLLVVGFASLVIAGFANRPASKPFAAKDRWAAGVTGILIAALLAMLWGVYSVDTAWVLRGWGMCLSCLIALLAGFSMPRLVQMSVLCFMVPVSLWTFSQDIHWFGQRLSTGLAGSILDLAKIYYFNKGNVIGLVSTDFLETGQCAGIRLLGPVLVIVLTYGFTFQYRWFRVGFLILEALFWIVVWNALRIAYCVWVQDSQTTPVDWNFLLLDMVCLLGTLFLTWSGDQFYAAFTYKEKDGYKEEARPSGLQDSDSMVEGNEKRSSGYVFAAGVILVTNIALGFWGIHRGVWGDAPGYGSLRTSASIEKINFDSSIDGWKVTETEGSDESFIPVFRQSSNWSHREWEFTRDGVLQTTMKLRVDGPWLHPPRMNWIWNWFGWKTASFLSDAKGDSSWVVRREIVQEGFVVSRDLSLPQDDRTRAQVVQIALVQEGFRAISEEDRKAQRELFSRLREAIEQQLRASLSVETEH